MSLPKLYVVTDRNTGEFLSMSEDVDTLPAAFQGEVWVARISADSIATMRDLVAQKQAGKALKHMRLCAHSINKHGDM
jgi:hypothetical protein